MAKGPQNGKSNNPNGRGKGIPNKNKRRFIVALQDMFENNEDKIAGWLEQIAKDNPVEAMNQLNKWAEFCFPKLARTELSGIDGEEIRTQTNVEIRFIQPEGENQKPKNV